MNTLLFIDHKRLNHFNLAQSITLPENNWTRVVKSYPHPYRFNNLYQIKT
ncbi:MAG TPA: hypothetical protein PKV50_04205 [Prolixibacteraceae bacterium]|nr:hypothetical protein [Prolixibacteraceae bacterium]HUM88709.1 hypothetical protein [Prolixibacteraceae bacterium]